MPDQQTFLQAMYKEHCDQARQHETLRQQAATLIFTITGAIVAFSAAILTSVDKPSLIPPALALVVLGIIVAALGAFGRGVSVKHYEKNRSHMALARYYRRALQRLFPQENYGQIRVEAREAHQQAMLHDRLFYEMRGIEVHTLWNNMYLVNMSVGLLLVIIGLFGLIGKVSSYLRHGS